MTRSTGIAVAAALLLPASAVRAESPVIGGGESFRLNGYYSVEFEKQFEEKGRGDPHGSFDADLFDIVLNWTGSEHVRMAADLTWEHGPATEDGYGNVAVEYAWAEYAFKDWARVRVGKMFTPFGIYNEIHTAKPALLTVKEPDSTNRTQKFGLDHRLYPRWTMGAALLGNGTSPVGDWDYVVAVANGENDSGTENPFDKDDNTQKAVMGRVRLHVTQRLQLGASFYTDALTEYQDVAGELVPTGGRTRENAFGAHAIWTMARPAVGLELEWVSGTRRYSSAYAVANGLHDAWSSGASAMAWWTIAEAVTPYVRWEWFDPDSREAHDIATNVIAGVNWRVRGGLVLKAEVDTYRAGVDNARFSNGRNAYSELKAAMVLGF